MDMANNDWDGHRSTPQIDSFYGGRQDLTAALGFESNGQTVILFRRKLNGAYPRRCLSLSSSL